MGISLSALLVLVLRDAAALPWLSIVFVAALTALTMFGRSLVQQRTINLEAAIAFFAAVAFADWRLVLLATFLGAALFHLLELPGRESNLLKSARDVFETSLAAVGATALYVSLLPASPSLAEQASAGFLLLAGYLGLRLLAVFLSAETGNRTFRMPGEWFAAESTTLFLVIPIVAAAVMSYRGYGMAGAVVAFAALWFLAQVLRTREHDENARAGDRSAAEIEILSRGPMELFSAEGDDETLNRLIRLLNELAPLRAAAVVTSETMPSIPVKVYRFGDCHPPDQAIQRFFHSAGYTDAAPKHPTLTAANDRICRLSNYEGSQVAVGIQTVEVIYGVLVYESSDPALNDPRIHDLFELLATQTAFSLQAQLLRRGMHEKTEELEKKAETTATLLQVSTGLMELLDVDAMLTRVAVGIRESLGFSSVLFALHVPERDEFVRRAHAGLDSVWEEMQKKPAVSGKEMRKWMDPNLRISNSFFLSHNRLLADDLSVVLKTEEGTPAEEWHPLDLLLIPLNRGAEVIGYLSVSDPADLRVPTVETVQTLQIFANQAVTALQSAHQYEEIRRLTNVDVLTPAFNHRYFQQALVKEIHRNNRSLSPFAVAMLDIDNFKSYNDTYGHPIGDEILKGLVEELQLNLRDVDIVSRYGGEEFAVILPDASGEEAFEVAERIRERIAAREFKFDGIGMLHIEVSIGVALFPADGQTAVELISRADTALYAAKKSGKNQVVMAHENSVTQFPFGKPNASPQH